MLFSPTDGVGIHMTRQLQNNKAGKCTLDIWGLKWEALRALYDGAILSELAFAPPVWVEGIDIKYNHMKLESPKNSLQVE